jgi:CDP-diacylglycerol--glycerol-3-phosphate 3-phosphatidyltransferase
MTGLTLAGAGVVSALGVADLVVTVGTAAGALLGAVGVVQLGVWLRRMLAD